MYQGLDDHAAPQETLPEELEKQIIDILFRELEGGAFGINNARADKIKKATCAIVQYVAPKIAALQSHLTEAIKERDEFENRLTQTEKNQWEIVKDFTKSAFDKADQLQDLNIELEAELSQAKAEIQSLREAKGMRWVPGEERLPDKSFWYICKIEGCEAGEYWFEKEFGRFINVKRAVITYPLIWLDETAPSDQSLRDQLAQAKKDFDVMVRNDTIQAEIIEKLKGENERLRKELEQAYSGLDFKKDKT